MTCSCSCCSGCGPKKAPAKKKKAAPKKKK